MQKYHIEGTELFGYSTVKRYLYSLYMFMNTVQRICQLYNYSSVLDMRGYVAYFCNRRLKAFDTLYKVVTIHRDYISANCILRMLGDSVAIFNLIYYMEENEEFKWFRHALYVLDGCEDNLKVLDNGDLNKGSMPDCEFEEYNKKLRYNQKIRQRLIYDANYILNNLSLPQKDKEAFDIIVSDRNWKFKEFKSYKKKGANQYKWSEMYKMIEDSNHHDILSFISQFAHGLSMSNLVMDMNEENRDGILSEALVLMNKLNRCTLSLFQSKVRYIMDGLLEPQLRDQIFACFDEEHRPSIEQWNDRVRKCVVGL